MFILSFVQSALTYCHVDFCIFSQSALLPVQNNMRIFCRFVMPMKSTDGLAISTLVTSMFVSEGEPERERYKMKRFEEKWRRESRSRKQRLYSNDKRVRRILIFHLYSVYVVQSQTIALTVWVHWLITSCPEIADASTVNLLPDS